MRVLICCQADLRGPSEKQAFGFAERMAALGSPVLLALHGDPASAAAQGLRIPSRMSVAAYGFRGPWPDRSFLRRVREFAPEVVYAFSPRRRALSASLAASRAAGGAPLAVHYEDDEWSLLAGREGEPVARRLLRAAGRRAAPLVPGRWPFVDPGAERLVRERARGLDAIVPALAGEVERRLGRECAVLLPVLPELPEAAAAPWPAGLEGRPVVAYTGNVFGPHLEDFDLLLRALARLSPRIPGLALVHAGDVAPRFDLAGRARAAGLGPGALHRLGPLPLAQVPGLLRRADVLVQPGHPSDFNRLRLPSKLQAYLASGTPTVTFACGFGELLGDGEEALLTRTGDPEELAAAIERCLTDGELAARLRAGGPAAARRLFDPERNTRALLEHLAACAATAPAR